MTFDTETTDANNKKQGVFFLWGSLIGISPYGSSYGSTVRLYVPAYVSGGSSSWGTQTGSTMTWSNIPYTTTGDAGTTYLNDAAQNTDANYAAKKGDICQYLSKTGAVSGSWRMPTQQEFQATGTTNEDPSSSTIWSLFGGSSWSSVSIANDEAGRSGLTSIDRGVILTVSGATTSYPASGFRNTLGTLYLVGQRGHYWSSSAYSSTNGYRLYFGSSGVYPAYDSPRQYGFAVRCVQN